MNKYFVLLIFIATFSLLLRKDRAYVVPLILIVYSNINGLLDWEDFGVHGVIKFQDYGLIITLMLIVSGWISSRSKILSYERSVRHTMLYKSILLYWGYYLYEFVYSILLQGGAEWPIKMGRVFFFGLVFFVIYKSIKNNPIAKFEKIITLLMNFTLVFAGFYVVYNVFGVDIYPTESYENFASVGLDEVKRNFSGLPTFAGYFIIYFTHQLMEGRGSKLINFFGLFLLIICQVLSLTRGFVVLTIAIILLTIFYRKISIITLVRLTMLAILGMIAMPFLLDLAPSYVEVIGMRFNEFFDAGGATKSGNFLVRAEEFDRVVSNVIDFNPFFGFGFTNISLLDLGYYSSVLHAGSADNGFSNLIGTTGFIGLGIFLLVVVFWIAVNLKLQRLNKEPYAKINFLFIIYMLVSFANGSSMSYMHNYALFIAYDLLAYAYLKRAAITQKIQQNFDHTITPRFDKL